MCHVKRIGNVSGKPAGMKGQLENDITRLKGPFFLEFSSLQKSFMLFLFLKLREEKLLGCVFRHRTCAIFQELYCRWAIIVSFRKNVSD